MKFEDLRERMVKNQLISRGISDEKILDVFNKVPRHIFVPKSIQNLAYNDCALGIGEAQTISQPYIVALMLSLLDLKSTDKVLEIGTGSGYQTAILAELAGEVYTVDRIDSLSRQARRVLKSLNYSNIHYRVGDGTRGWEKAYPVCNSFDKIIISAAAPNIPEKLKNQLNENGLMVLPCGSRNIQEMILIKKINGEFKHENHGGCTFVPLIGEDGWDS